MKLGKCAFFCAMLIITNTNFSFAKTEKYHSTKYAQYTMTSAKSISRIVKTFQGYNLKQRKIAWISQLTEIFSHFFNKTIEQNKIGEIQTISKAAHINLTLWKLIKHGEEYRTLSNIESQIDQIIEKQTTNRSKEKVDRLIKEHYFVQENKKSLKIKNSIKLFFIAAEWATSIWSINLQGKNKSRIVIAEILNIIFEFCLRYFFKEGEYKSDSFVSKIEEVSFYLSQFYDVGKTFTKWEYINHKKNKVKKIKTKETEAQTDDKQLTTTETQTNADTKNTGIQTNEKNISHSGDQTDLIEISEAENQTEISLENYDGIPMTKVVQDAFSTEKLNRKIFKIKKLYTVIKNLGPDDGITENQFLQTQKTVEEFLKKVDDPDIIDTDEKEKLISESKIVKLEMEKLLQKKDFDLERFKIAQLFKDLAWQIQSLASDTGKFEALREVNQFIDLEINKITPKNEHHWLTRKRKLYLCEIKEKLFEIMGYSEGKKKNSLRRSLGRMVESISSKKQRKLETLANILNETSEEVQSSLLPVLDRLPKEFFLQEFYKRKDKK